MSHLFALEDLARYKLCLHFSTLGSLSTYWEPLNEPMVYPPSSPVFIRVDETFVNGYRSLSLFLVRGDDSNVSFSLMMSLKD